MYGGSIENRSRLLKEVMLAVCQEIGSARCGIRISPVTPANDASDASPQALFEHVASFLGSLSLAYVHTIEGSTGAARDYQQGKNAFDYAALKSAYRQAGGQGAWMLNNGYEHDLADQALNEECRLNRFWKSLHRQSRFGGQAKKQGPLQHARQSHLLWRWRKGLYRLPEPLTLLVSNTRSWSINAFYPSPMGAGAVATIRLNNFSNMGPGKCLPVSGSAFSANAASREDQSWSVNAFSAAGKIMVSSKRMCSK